MLKSWFGGAELSLSFCLSIKLLISPSYLNEIFAGYSNLGCRFSSFMTLCSAIPFWPEEFLLKHQLLSLWESLCVLFVSFSIFSFCLIFINLIKFCLGVFHLGFILFGTLWVSWTWVAISYLILGKFSTIISSSIFSWSFFCLLLLGRLWFKCWGV